MTKTKLIASGLVLALGVSCQHKNKTPDQASENSSYGANEVDRDPAQASKQTDKSAVVRAIRDLLPASGKLRGLKGQTADKGECRVDFRFDGSSHVILYYPIYISSNGKVIEQGLEIVGRFDIDTGDVKRPIEPTVVTGFQRTGNFLSVEVKNRYEEKEDTPVQYSESQKLFIELRQDKGKGPFSKISVGNTRRNSKVPLVTCFF